MRIKKKLLTRDGAYRARYRFFVSYLTKRYPNQVQDFGMDFIRHWAHVRAISVVTSGDSRWAFDPYSKLYAF